MKIVLMNVKVNKYIMFLFLLCLISCKEKEYFFSSDGLGKKKIKSECDVSIFGNKVGKCIYYTLEGDTLGISEFKKGILNGKSLSFHSNGVVQTVSFLTEGVLDGNSYEYYNNTQIAYKLVYENGRLINVDSVFDFNGRSLKYGNLDTDGNGNLFNYDKGGKLSSKGRYKNGYRFGWWYIYTNNGMLQDSAYYDENSLVDYFGY